MAKSLTKAQEKRFRRKFVLGKDEMLTLDEGRILLYADDVEQHLADELARQEEAHRIELNEILDEKNLNFQKELSRQKKELLKELSLCNECYERNKE